MTRSLSRRRLLAASVPGLLAGCLLEPSESDGGGGTGGGGGSESESPTGGEPDAGSEGTTGSEETTGGEETTGNEGDSTTEETDAEQTDEESAPESVGPDGSGLVVTSEEVLSVTSDGSETTVKARLIVENRGRFTYGTIEFRVEAYATRPNSPERSSVGSSYVTRRFLSGNRFEDGAQRFETSITFRSRETNVPADTDWYAVDAVVRRADPV